MLLSNNGWKMFSEASGEETSDREIEKGGRGYRKGKREENYLIQSIIYKFFREQSNNANISK